MNASLFVLLPEGNAVLDLPITKEDLMGLFSPLLQIKEYARSHGINLRIYFDQSNISQFKQDVGVVVDDGSYLNKPSAILRQFIGSNSSDVQKVQLLDLDCSYIRWDTISCTADFNSPLLVKSAYEVLDAPCLLSLMPGEPTNYYQVSIIKDRAYSEDLPLLKNIPLFCKVDECIEWLSSLEVGHFSLIGNQSFVRTSFHWKNQCIFKKKDDDNYWYFDYFHRENKIHYEVFNSDGDHIGEASENGVLIAETADSEKSIRRILHGK